MPNKDKTLWVFIDDSISKDNKYFLTMFIVTEYKDFDNEIKIMRSRLRNMNKKDFRTNLFLDTPKSNKYYRLKNLAKNIVDNVLEDCLNKIIEHDYIKEKILDNDFINYYYKDHIKMIVDNTISKYQSKYTKIVFDHSSNVNVNKLIIYENLGKDIRIGDDQEDTGLIVVDLLRTKINF